MEESLSVILTTWKRNYLSIQLDALKQQSYPIKEIIVYQNDGHLNLDELKSHFNFKHIHSKDINFKFHGRFTIPLLLDSDYIAIFDDDTIPAPRWLEGCMRLSKEHDCIVGGNGRIMVDEDGVVACRDAYYPSLGNSTEKDIEVDFVGHCWFFKREWIYNMWKTEPYTLDNAEDIHFCASCKVEQGIRSFISSQSDQEFLSDSQKHFGADRFASHKQPGHEKVRDETIEFWRNKGWNLLNIQ
tara:strand:- start:314 stop:1039 length:726 start_codon:yes stop_codon:yes gene_type:complete